MLAIISNFYRQTYRAITDFEFYRTIYRQPLKHTVFFFLILALHDSVLSAVYRVFDVGRRLNAFALWADQRSPGLEVRGGRLIVNAELPVIMRYPQDPHPSLVFVEDAENNLPAYDAPALLFTPRGLYLNDADGPFLPWSVVPEGMRRPLSFRRSIDALFWPISLLVTAITFFVRFLARLIETVIFATFCFSAALRYQPKWPFKHFAALAVYALVPATIIKLLGLFLGLEGTVFGLTYLATAGIFCYQATVRTLEAEMVPTNPR